MVYVSDVVDANIFCMNHPEKMQGRVFDVGTGSNISLNEIASMVKGYHNNINIDYIDPRPGEVLSTKADISGLLKMGWQSQISIIEGLMRCFSLSNHK